MLVITRNKRQRVIVGGQRIIEVRDTLRHAVLMHIDGEPHAIRVGGALKIAEGIFLTVLGVSGRHVRLGIEAPKSVSIHREEVQQRIEAEEASAKRGTAVVRRELGVALCMCVSFAFTALGMLSQVLA